MRESKYDWDKSITIPTSQWSAIIGRRTNNQWRNLTPESAIPRIEGKVNRRLPVCASCIPTALTTSKKPGGQRKQQRQLGESQNGSDKKCNFRPFISKPAETCTSANSNNSNNSDPGNSKSVKSNTHTRGSRADDNQRRGSERKSTKAERQTGIALAAPAATTKPYMQPCMRYNRTESRSNPESFRKFGLWCDANIDVAHGDLIRRISSLKSLYDIYTATCSKSKYQSTAVQWASLYCRAYLGNSTYHTNQHSPPPWPGDDVCREWNGQTLGSGFWIP